MGDKRDKKKRVRKEDSVAATSNSAFRISISDIAGNQAVKRLLEGKIPALGLQSPELMRSLQPLLHPSGLWHLQALPRLNAADIQDLMILQSEAFSANGDMPPGVNLARAHMPADNNNEFVVAGSRFGVTIVHPETETMIRVVEEDHRYKPEDWTYETRTQPKETPSIAYQLIAPQDGKPGEVLLAIGPGAFVEVSEPAPYENAKEWKLANWQPRMGGTFDVTVIEMPDNSLVPLPGEDIDIATLRQAGGKDHYPDKHIWRGAISYQDYMMTMCMLIADIAFAIVPIAAELSEAASLASEAALEADALLPEEQELTSAGILEAGGDPAAEISVDDVGPSQGQTEISDRGPVASDVPSGQFLETDPSMEVTPGENPSAPEAWPGSLNKFGTEIEWPRSGGKFGTPAEEVDLLN